RGPPHAGGDHRAGAQLPRAAVRLRRRRPLARPRGLDRLLGAAARRRGRRQRRRRTGERGVVRRGIPPPPRLRPQRDRRLRAVAPAQQGRLQPDRARAAARRVHPRRSARGVRGDPRTSARPGELPPSGRELGDPHPHRPLPHRQPPAGAPVPLQPGCRTRRPRPPRHALKPGGIMSAVNVTLQPRSVDPSVDHEIQAIVVGALRETEVCTTDLAGGPWNFDSRPGYGPGSSMGDVIPVGSPRQGELPQEYREASEDELAERIRAAKETLGDRVVVLGHFYQRQDVVRHADYVGDSFQLANAAKSHPEAEAIVFCGVHFMAETADLLSGPDQAVILPNLAAGCSMADMASIDEVEECWEQLAEVYGDMSAQDADGRVPVIPVTYMNSSAAIKGFVGRNGGIVCTSSNARTVLEWAFERGHRVLFFPDQHLGRNTAKAMGVPLERMPMWNPRRA